MNSPSPLTICLCVQLTVFLLGSAASAGSSLWGNKVRFNGRPCKWQLQPRVVVPALTELSVCVLIRRKIATEWTGFAYKAPGDRNIELGFGGTGSQLRVWLFGEVQHLDWELKPKEWYSVCLTWSGRAGRLRAYVNGTALREAPVSHGLAQALAPNGTLTLGVSHYVDVNGEVQSESGSNLMGEIGLFRMWSRERSAEELRRPNCADGDVVGWDRWHWKYSCPPVPDTSLHCAWSFYKIKMWIDIVPSTELGNCVYSLEGVTRSWLESIFPKDIFVRDISVLSPSHDCHVFNNSDAVHGQQPQGSRALSDSGCHKCFNSEVYVNVNPAANVVAIQAEMAARLSLSYSYDFLKLTADPESIRIIPVEFFPAVTDPPTTVASGETTSEKGPTQSLPAHPSNMSTTEDPLDLNETAVRPDTFFRVDMTLSMTGSPTNPYDTIEKWVKETLERNDTMLALNLVIKENEARNRGQNNGQTISADQTKLYFCSFHVQEYNIISVAEALTLINTALKRKYENGSVIIESTKVEIKHILPENCLEEGTSTIYGKYIWAETFPQVSQVMGCNKPRTERADRLCKLNIENDMTSWAEPDMTRCKQLVIMSDLDNIIVTTGNAAEVVDIIQSLVDVQLANSLLLSASELDSVVKKLREVVDVSVIGAAVGADVVDIIADVLLSDTDVAPAAKLLLDLTDRMGSNMDYKGDSLSLTAPSLALSMVNIDAEGFRGLTFGVSSVSAVQDPETFINQSFVSGALPDTVATIALPSVLHNFFTRNKTRVQFEFYGTDELFQDPYTTNATHSSLTLNSYIVSASINNSHVSNMADRVVVTLRHKKPKQPEHNVQCMFWDFRKNGGNGGWNSSGCETQNTTPYQTSCLCDHLTHFAVLLDVSRTPIGEVDSQILTVISYIGCGLSSIFLGITLLTYLAFEKLRRDYPSKILINLSAALLGLSILFLLDSWLSSFSDYGLCIATAASVHYFLLASFTWMGLEAVHMYLALVKVFNIYVPSYILKFCAVGWGLAEQIFDFAFVVTGVPLVIVSLVLAIDKDAYGNTAAEEARNLRQSTDQFCWLQDDVFFYVTVVAFVLLILLCNVAVFVVVLIQIRRMRANKPSANSAGSLQDLRAVASLTVLLGLTWSMGFFSFGPGKVVMMYLFSIFNTLQGFFVFVFHCLMKENVRKQWRIHLCCGRVRPSDCSDWSRSATVGGCGKKGNLISSDSVASNNTTTRKISDSSASSAPTHHHQGA